MTGYQVLKRIRTIIKDVKTTIVMATSLAGSEDVLSCMKLGIEGYIVKPFALSDIWFRILEYYAKQEPARAKKAEALCRVTLKSPMETFLAKDESTAKEDTKSFADGPLSAETKDTQENKDA